MGAERADGRGSVAALRAPRAPTVVPPSGFPLAATLAPVVVSVALFAVTGSPFALLFAVLGPVVALATLVDGRVHSRRRRRRELRRFESESQATRAAIDAGHHAERERLAREHPPIEALLTTARDPGVWPHGSDLGEAVRLGVGSVPSRLRVDRVAGDDADPAVRRALDRLTALAEVLDDAPATVDATSGVGFCGPAPSADAAARAFVMRLARLVDPQSWTSDIRAPSRAPGPSVPPSWTWLDSLPHAIHVSDTPQQDGDALEVTFAARRVDGRLTPEAPGERGPRSRLRVAVARSPDALPRWCRTVVSVQAAGESAVQTHDDDGSPARVRCDLATEAEAAAYARALSSAAEREGRMAGLALPTAVAFGQLDHAPDRSDGLMAELGTATTREAWRVDLVADGPHAVIGGTTGSGKSELLVTWVLALAARHPPSRVTFLLVDFKGGSTFDALAPLPHRVGTITDLDEAQARRALESLRAEIRYRETALAEAGARSIDDPAGASALSRLVIVVDEFAALSATLPELHGVFADLAARGRSLGVHLILCTQRPAASLRDAILANCTLRVCLRVNDAADSVALVGVGAAASLPRRPAGRALVSAAGEPPRPVQIALVDDPDLRRVVASWPQEQVRRPWCDPLPALLPLSALPASLASPVSPASLDLPYPPASPDSVDGAGGTDRTAIVFGLADLPSEQRQRPAVWRPRLDGCLLVIGGRGTGKSTTLAAIEHRVDGAIRVPADVEGAWDALVEATRVLDAPGGAAAPRTLIVDDLDALVARFGRDHQLEFVDLIARLVRDGPRHGVTAVFSTSSTPTTLYSAVADVEARLLLRMPSRQEHLLAGGATADHDDRLAPGGGWWRGDRVQVGWTPLTAPTPPMPAPVLDFPLGGTTAMVSSSPRSLRGRLAAAASPAPLRMLDLSEEPHRAAVGTDVVAASAGEHLMILGDPDAWQSAWTLLAAVRSRARMAFDGCSVAEYRALTRSRRMPPALDPTRQHGWLLTPHDEICRFALAPPRDRP